MQLASTMITDFIVWQCHCYLLERRSTVYVVEVDASSQGIQILYRKWMLNMIRLAKWRNQQTVQNTLWLNNQQFASIYHFHSAPVPPTWLHKENKQQHFQQEREAAVSDTHDESPSRYITSSHSSRFSEKYTCVAQDKTQGVHWKQH